MFELITSLQSALADRYAIERELGHGGMATVFVAYDLRHHRQVAIKVLLPELAATLGAERFLRRARPALYAASAIVVLAAGYFLFTHGPARGGIASSGESAQSIAVLPFVNIGADPDNEYFSDGMSEELTTALAKVEGLRVAARTSAFSFKGKDVDVREIGRTLDVGYVLEGSVRKAGHRLRVSTQLISAANGYHLWSDEYERDDRDVFAVQDEIARAIVGALRVKLTGAATASLVKRSTASPEAHDLYLQGRYFYEKRDEVGLRKAKEYFERAIQKDSSFALAYSGLSDTYSFLSAFGYVAPRDIFPQAKAAALRAIQLDSTLVEAHTSLAFVSLFYDWDWAAAAREFDRALALNAQYAPAHLFHAWYFVAVGKLNDAISELRRARELDPLSLIINTRLATMLFWARRYDEALAQSRHTLELDATYLPAREAASRAYLLLGRCAEALGQIEHGPELTAGWARADLGYTYARCGRRTEALAELEHLGAEAKEGQYISRYALAMIWAGLGDKERAFAELDSAYEERAFSMFLLRVEPAFDGMRADPRFARLVKKVGMPS